MPTAKTLFALLLVAAFGDAQPSASVPKGWHEFVSDKAGYIAYYPGDWYLLLRDAPTLYIANFQPSHAARAVIVPANGATISIAPPPAGITSIDQWISDATAAHSVRSRRTFSLQRPEGKASVPVHEVVFGSIEGPDTTSWYFELSGRLLVANLSYWEGDRAAPKYRSVLTLMLRFIAPLQR